MKRQLHSSYSDEDDSIIDLTPLIDVVFVVLIAFIIIAPMLEIDHIDLASSSSEVTTRSSLNQADPSAIYVKADNSIWVAGQQIPIAQLEFQLQKMKVNAPNKALQVYHDKQACFGTYQTIKNTAEKIGFEQLDVILKPS